MAGYRHGSLAVPTKQPHGLSVVAIRNNFRTSFRLDIVALVAYAKHMLKKGPSSERHVRVFRNGRNQAVRIPREFELPAEEAIMRKEGHRLIIEPVPAKSLRAVLAGLKPLREKFPRIPDTPAEPVGL